LLEQARTSEKDNKESIAKLGIRSVGVVPLGDCHRLEQGLLAPALVREVMLSWIGNPATAPKKASLVVQRLMRRIGLTPKAITAQIQTFLAEKQITADIRLDDNDSRLDSQQTNANQDPVALQIEALANSGQFDWMCAGWINNLYREISLGISDRRVDLVTAIESLKLIRHETTQLKMHSLNLRTDPTTDGSQIDAQRISNESFVNKCVSVVTGVQFENLSASIQFLEDRLERFSTILAIAINESKRTSTEESAWASMPPQINEHLPELKVRLHDATVNAYLVRPLNDQNSNVDAAFMTAELSRHATDLVIPIVQQHNDLLVAQTSTESKQVDKVEDSTKTLSSSVMLKRSVDATQAMPDSGHHISTTPTTIEEAIELARPELLSLGGMQRLVLVVSNEIERGRMESELRAIYDGAVTVAVIPGSAPKLVHEAQQIELKNVLSRLSALNGGNEHVTARLASRTDVDW
jgi:hypothetical protein